MWGFQLSFVYLFFSLSLYLRLADLFVQYLVFPIASSRRAKEKAVHHTNDISTTLIIIRKTMLKPDNSGNSSMFTNQGALLGRGQSDVSSCFAAEHHDREKLKIRLEWLVFSNGKRKGKNNKRKEGTKI